MTSHEFALAVARIIRDALYVNDGHQQPTVGGVLNPLWVQARANNAAVAIADLFEREGKELARLMTERGSVVVGEIASPMTTASRYGFPPTDEPPPVRVTIVDPWTLEQREETPEDTAIGVVRAPGSWDEPPFK